MADSVNYNLYLLPGGNGITLGTDTGNYTGYQQTDLAGAISSALASLQKYKSQYENPTASMGPANIAAAKAAFDQYGGQAAFDALSSYQAGTPLTEQQAQYLSQGLGGNIDATKLMQFSQNQPVPSGMVKGPITAENTAGLYTQESYNQLFGDANTEGSNAWHEAQVAAGREVKVPIGSGFGYVPAGTAGADNLVNIGTNNTAEAANAGLPAVQGGTATAPTTLSAPAGQVNIGTAEAPLLVPEGSPAHQLWVQNQGTQTSTQGGGVPTTGTSGTSGAAPTLTNEQMRANLAAILPADFIASIPDSQLSAFSAISDSYKQMMSQGLVNSNINAGDLQKAIDNVASDKEFIAKYGDQLKLSTANFQNSLQDLQFQTGQLQQQQANQFSDQQKQAAEQAAEYGQAYSGFRQQAKQRLESDQTGIIQSTRQMLKNNLQSLGQGWEGMFGSAKAQTPSIDYVNPLTGQLEQQSYNPFGQIYGSVPLAQKQEQQSLGEQRFYNEMKLPI